MRTAYYDQVFLAPLARSQPAARRTMDAIIEREFSDELRDPRFLPGWYILPGLAVAGFLVVVAMLAK